MVARGYVRSTLDFDFLTTDKRVLDTASWAGLEGGEVDIRSGALDDPFEGVVHVCWSDGVDTNVVIGRSTWEQAVIDRSELMDVEGVMMPVPRVSDLILLKLAAGGGLDLQDIGNLMEVHGRAPTVAEVEAHIDEVRPDIRDTWAKVLASLSA